MNRFRLVLILLIVVACGKEKPQDNHTPLTKEARIVDLANKISPTAEDSIFNLIRNLEKDIGSQIAVITIETLNGEEINSFSIRAAEQMGLGRDKYLDGVLLVFSLQEKLMRIEVGFGLEKILRDEIAKRICTEIIAPRFIEGNYGQGIYLGIAEVKKLIEQNKNMVGKK